MRALMFGLFTLAVAGLIGGLIFLDAEGRTEENTVALAQAEASAARERANEIEAKADLVEQEKLKVEAEGERERAKGDRSFREAEGRAIEAPALAAAGAVEAQTEIVLAMGRTNTLYGRMMPGGVVLLLVVVGLLAFGVGGVFVVAAIWTLERNRSGSRAGASTIVLEGVPLDVTGKGG